MSPRTIPEQLLDAYKTTRYCVFNPKLEIKIDQSNPALDEILKQYNESSWVFITASNPFSNILSDCNNDERHLQLKQAVKKYTYFEGEGIGENPAWKPEQSLLVLGITTSDATELGERFEQNAIVIGNTGQPAELLVLI